MKEAAARYPSTKWCVFFVVVLANFWSIIASFLAARNLISCKFENSGYFVCFCIILFCFVVPAHWCLRRTLCNGIFLLPCLSISLGLVVTSCNKSDETFMAWKLKTMSKKDWQDITSDLKRLAAKPSAIKDKDWNTQQAWMPLSFARLGVASESRIIFLIDDKKPCVMFADGRRWGVFIEDKNTPMPYFPKEWWTPLSQDAYFFVLPF